MKKIFISHKYKDNPIKNRKDADRICKYWLKKGYLPISPLHLFSYMNGDNNRAEIMEVCKKLIELCDIVAVYHQSEGCRIEEKYAEKCGKKVIRMYPELTNDEIIEMMTNPKDIHL